MLNRILFALSLLIGAIVFATPSDAWLKHGAASSSCPQATDNGCAAAPAHGEYFPGVSLLTSAQQSGQNSLLPSRGAGNLTLNIPGVDYGIGPDSTLSPQDPRTISDATCHYNNFGGSPALEVVLCYGSGVVNYTLNNYDFGGHKLGKNAVILYLDKTPSAVSAGSTFTITNCYFDTVAGGGSHAGYGVALGFTGNWSVIAKNNQFDGTFVNTGSDQPFRDDGDLAGTSMDVEYNAFTNTNASRVLANLRYMPLTFKYNFVQGINDVNDGCALCDHGEVAIRACPLGGCTSLSDNYEGNFVIWNTLPSGTINNATFFGSSGASDGITLTSFTIKNNVVVTNTSGTPATPSTSAQVGKALFNTRIASLGTVTITGNWMGATGSSLCGISGTAQNGDGTASTSGNTINITALDSSFNNGPIEPGYLIINPGFTTAKITAYGTGTGITGTYTFDGAPQTQGSTSTWTIVPGYTGTPTLTPNWNLDDPSHTGSPQAVGFTGPTMVDTNCQGEH